MRLGSRIEASNLAYLANSWAAFAASAFCWSISLYFLTEEMRFSSSESSTYAKRTLFPPILGVESSANSELGVTEPEVVVFGRDFALRMPLMLVGVTFPLVVNCCS